jgi:hypothetical protein
MAKEKEVLAKIDRTIRLDKHVAALERLRRHNTLMLREVISRVLEDFARDSTLTYEERTATLLQIRSDLSSHVTKLVSNIPKKAPSMWSDRDKSKQETPIGFIRRVYADSLGRGLTQSDIRRLDFDLYRALQNWKQRHAWPSDFPLGTKQHRNDMLLRSYVAGNPPLDPIDAARAALNPEARLFEAARNRARKVKK